MAEPNWGFIFLSSICRLLTSMTSQRGLMRANSSEVLAIRKARRLRLLAFLLLLLKPLTDKFGRAFREE